jgi:hypothetical protein
MKFGMCVLCQYFLELSAWGKLAMISGYILMALLLILWETSKTHRRFAMKSPMVTPNSLIDPTEKLVHTVAAAASNQNQYNPRKGARYLLKLFRSNFSKPIVYCQSHNARQKHLKPLQQYLPQHIRTILNWLARRVNQSGKEPSVRGLDPLRADVVPGFRLLPHHLEGSQHSGRTGEVHPSLERLQISVRVMVSESTCQRQLR